MNFAASISLTTLLVSGGLCVMLVWVLRWHSVPEQGAEYRHWIVAWQAQAAYYLIGAVAFVAGVLGFGTPGLRLVFLSIPTQVASALAAVLLVTGTFGFVHRRSVPRRVLRMAIAAAIIGGIAVALLATFFTGAGPFRAGFRALITAASFLASAWLIWDGRARSDRPARMLAIALSCFGLANVNYLIFWAFSVAGRTPSYSLSWFALLDLLWIAAIAMSMVALALAEQRETGIAALREQERSFQRMIENSSDILAVFDAERNLQYLSPSAERVLGWTNELRGRSVLDFVHPEDIGGLAARISSAQLAHGPFLARIRASSGNWVRLEAVTRRLEDESGRPIVVVNARDVTEREQLETSLRESQKLDSIGRLAGGVAHDLNNILMVIANEADLAVEEAPASLHPSLEAISAASARATEMTRQLLTFARRQPVQPSVVDVLEVVTRTLRMTTRLMRESIELRSAATTDRHFALVDPTQLEQVVMNLIVNARDAIQGHGYIDVTVGLRTLDSEHDKDLAAGDYVSITIRDTGVGISEQIRPHLFEPFFTTKGLGEGTGLGLATSYGIVRQANGSISVTSEVGEGSTFEVLLPLTDETPQTGTPSLKPALRGNGEKVLIAEDDESVRRLVARVLHDAGYHVIEAADGAEAVAAFAREADICVLVSDVIMPRLNGAEVARQIRALDPEIGVLLVSGYAGDRNLLNTLSDNTVFLQKPVPGRELVRAVHALASRKKGHSEAQG